MDQLQFKHAVDQIEFYGMKSKKGKDYWEMIKKFIIENHLNNEEELQKVREDLVDTNKEMDELKDQVNEDNLAVYNFCELVEDENDPDKVREYVTEIKKIVE